MARSAFWDIVDLLGLVDVRGPGIGGSLYEEDVRAVAESVGIAYQGERARTWSAIIERLGGSVDLEADVSSGGTIENPGLEKVRDLLAAGQALRNPEHVPQPEVVGAAIEAGAYDRSMLVDERIVAMAAIVRRRGQPRFRAELMRAYGGACAITGCRDRPALEAAHIDGYLGPTSNDVRNGLLLRGDVHTLFDLALITIDVGVSPALIIVHRSLADQMYRSLHNAPLRLPVDMALHPSFDALREHHLRQTS